MERVVKFLRNIKPDDDIVIVYNNDEDGICSCVMIKKVLKLTREPYIIPQPMPTDENLIKRIQTTLPKKIIFLDLAVDQQTGVLKKLSSVCDILIIDHHQVTKNMNSRAIVHYNPRFKDPKIYQSTSYVVYKICSKIMDMSNLLWIATIGIIGDYNLEDSMDLVEEARKKYNFKDIEESSLKKISDMIVATRATKALACDKIVEILEKAENPEKIYDIEDVNKMIEAYKIIENEKLSLLLDAEKNSERIGDLILYNYKSESNLRSEIATKLSEKYPKKVIIIYGKVGNKIKISARNQSRNYNIGKILEAASKGMKASAGGHDVAAGATLQAGDWEEFKNNLISIVK